MRMGMSIMNRKRRRAASSFCRGYAVAKRRRAKTVQNLLNRHKAHTFDEIATRLPAETQLYVPKVEATILRREGLRLNQLRAS